MVRIWGSALAVPALLVALVAHAGAEPGVEKPVTARSLAYGVKVLLPNRPPITAGSVSATAVAKPEAFAYPEDGSIVRIGSVAGRSTATVAAARARSDVRDVSLFGGEITADALIAWSAASVSTGQAAGSFEPSTISGLTVLGEAVTPAPDLRVPLADWGHLTLLEQRSVSSGSTSLRGWVTVLDVRLDGDHAGLPIGTRILVGYAEASARNVTPKAGPVVAPGTPTSPAPSTSAEEPASAPAEPMTSPTPAPSTSAEEPAPAEPVTGPTPAPVATRPRIRRGLGYPADMARPGTLGPSALALSAPRKLGKPTAEGYVFPVYGPSGFGDTFGAPRADVSWHHGADIFAPLGAPVVAVARGTLFFVGHNRIGGNRLWLRDRAGNEFYYAHLSAFAPLAANGARVSAGDVVGFVGNTGDADQTPYHLHFEIHPAPLLYLGYDGAVDPTAYLRAWRHLADVDFPSAAVWVPTITATGREPRPGAILLQASDISTASGLEPGSLAQAFTPTPAAGEGAIAPEPTRRRKTAP